MDGGNNAVGRFICGWLFGWRAILAGIIRRWWSLLRRRFSRRHLCTGRQHQTSCKLKIFLRYHHATCNRR